MRVLGLTTHSPLSSAMTFVLILTFMINTVNKELTNLGKNTSAKDLSPYPLPPTPYPLESSIEPFQSHISQLNQPFLGGRWFSEQAKVQSGYNPMFHQTHP